MKTENASKPSSAPVMQTALLGERNENEVVGRFTHRTDDDNDLMSVLGGADGFSSGTENFLSVGDAGSAEFLNNERHFDNA